MLMDKFLNKNLDSNLVYILYFSVHNWLAVE